MSNLASATALDFIQRFILRSVEEGEVVTLAVNPTPDGGWLATIQDTDGEIVSFSIGDGIVILEATGTSLTEAVCELAQYILENIDF